MIIKSSFEASWWLSNRHLQTLWGPLFRKKINNNIKKERMELHDGDFLDLFWTTNNSGPIIIVLHGLEGSYKSHYIPGILNVIHNKGWRGVLMHFRGCSGEPNRLPRCYHSGDTGDINEVVQNIRKREPKTPLAAVGYSMGGNVLLKWLGESGGNNPLSTSVAISPTFDLHITTKQLESGFSQIYQNKLIGELINHIKNKTKKVNISLDISNIDKYKTFRQFDDLITAPLHGFKGVDEYYNKSSCRQYIKDIQIPTLILHSKDDPFASPTAIPKLNELSSKIIMEISEKGGHTGFVSGMFPWKADYWLERRITDFLQKHLEK